LPRTRSVLSPADLKRRTPPGQTLTDKFPILTYGPTPTFDPGTWDFRMWGLVENEVRWSYSEFMALPPTKVVADFHCVTTWSRLDNEWEGVSFRELLTHVTPLPDAAFVMIHCDGGYTTNLSIEALVDDDVLFAYHHDGEDLDPEHGWPLRSIVPKLYAWKSAKWVRGLEFMSHDRPGFWEQNGYHMNGDPWTEERYG
jgi:DMSO/TMAO reductase YedYZ molybdopterin-dependent catalytic subunit